MGRRPRIDPAYGKVLSDREIRARFPGLSKDEIRRIRESVGTTPGAVPVDREKYAIGLLVPTVYDYCAFREVAVSERLPQGDLLLAALRAYLAARSK